MRNRTQNVLEVETLINELSSPLSRADEDAGWTNRAQEAILKLLNEIRENLIEGKPIPNLSIGRGLDHWGVEGGKLFTDICIFSNHLREMRGL